MAINPVIKVVEFIAGPRFGGGAVGLGEFTTVGTATTYLTTADDVDANGFVTDADEQITSDTRQVFSRGMAAAAKLVLRSKYRSSTIPPTTFAVVKVFGRTRYPDGTAGPWRILRSFIGDTSITLTCALSDQLITADEVRFTTPDDSTTVATEGCNEFLVAVEVAASGSGGTLRVRFE
jgi:hypothetical protein